MLSSSRGPPSSPISSTPTRSHRPERAGKGDVGENIADAGGLALSLDAYHASLGCRAAPVIDGTTGDQRFFLSWAQIWRVKTREVAARKKVVSDFPSPEKFRVNGIVRNMDAWYRAFDIKPTDKLYKPADDRVKIWWVEPEATGPWRTRSSP
ncbi:M13-type metalloendopeptidase [Sphingomonas faeni]|uniref:M13-type metalloendopeptidase n=1 Tax=Sphingomonas faeni TaxID=185950 RepID=UPI003357024C